MCCSVIYIDPSLLIVEKPQGLATGRGKEESLCEEVFTDYPEIGSIQGFREGEGGLLNRLDNETGGLVLFSRNDTAFEYYSRQMKEEKIKKHYTAVVEGRMEIPAGQFREPVAHHPRNQRKMVVVSGTQRYRGKPRPALTEFKVISAMDFFSLVSITITKGARHQIRVHLAHAGHPVIGDKLYGKNVFPGIKNHLLFATGLDFTGMDGEEKNIRYKPSLLDGDLSRLFE
ncbi:MAG: RNA pseudouridine synthase [Spirochaetales bacterium]|nr:RNA pseudouridine synthase [Spirochaetales bacterium]